MASKYEKLGRHLSSLSAQEWRARFSDIERVLGFQLPRSAREYPAWWANQEPPSSQSKAWQDAGWSVEELNLTAQQLIFRTAEAAKRSPASGRHRRTPKHVEVTNDPYDWDRSERSETIIKAGWTAIGRLLLVDGKLLFPKPDHKPGLYRFRIMESEGNELRYIGESSDVSRRFGNYRNPGASQQTNTRINLALTDAISRGCEIGVSVLVGEASISEGGEPRELNLALKPQRRLLENLFQVLDDALDVESMNL